MEATMSPYVSDDDGDAFGPLSHDTHSPSGSLHSHDDSHADIKDEGLGTGLFGLADAGCEPVHKRRRVTRACDECRRKKIKCDGKQPCTHCSVYSYNCTYDKPSNRRRNPAPQYVEALEARLQRAETLLHKVMPDVDLADPNLDPTVQQEFQNRERMRVQEQKQQQRDPKTQKTAGATCDGEELMSMIETIGQLDLTEGGEWDFHGVSSGAVFLHQMKENFQSVLGRASQVPFLARPPRPPGLLSLDSPRSSGSSPWDATAPSYYTLPPKEHARSLCYFALNCATCLLRIVHVPSFLEAFDRLYEQAPDGLGPDDHKQLGLLYAVLALGCMYNVSGDDDAQTPGYGYEAAMEEGVRYYASARLLLQDITDCRDLTSLQALLYMILFLQATSNLSGCYSFLGIALRTALRMGLHRNLPHVQLTPIESESRRRVFYVIRQMDTYVSALLGFPMALRDDDIDQPLPTEVDDEYITKDGILTPPADTPSFFQACNAYTRLMTLLTRVIRCIYPVRGVQEADGNGNDKTHASSTYMISYSQLKAIEHDLHRWFAELPSYWRPSADGPVEVVRVRTLLRFAYAHVQMMMYRPFLHYVSPRMAAGQTVDERYYACAAAAVSVSRNIVHIGLEMRKQAVLVGPYWFILYTEFFAVLSLVYYALSDPDKPGTEELMADALSGRAVLASLSKRSMAADRATTALDAFFEQLPDRLKKGKRRAAVPTRKRSAPRPQGPQGPQGPATAVTVPGSKGRKAADVGRPATTEALRAPVPQQRVSFDGLQPAGPVLPSSTSAPVFVSSFRDLVPLDMHSGTTSPDSSGTPSTSQQSAGFGPAPNHDHDPMHSASLGVNAGMDGFASAGTSSLYRLDAMMFPSGDPLAYPSQPIMDFGLPDSHTPQQEHLQQEHLQQHPDTMQFYAPNLYGDIQGQLLGPVPAYLSQTSTQGLDLASDLFYASNIISHEQQQHHQQHQHHHHHHHQHHQQRQDQNLESLYQNGNFDVFQSQF